MQLQAASLVNFTQFCIERLNLSLSLVCSFCYPSQNPLMLAVINHAQPLLYIYFFIVVQPVLSVSFLTMEAAKLFFLGLILPIVIALYMYN